MLSDEESPPVWIGSYYQPVRAALIFLPFHGGSVQSPGNEPMCPISMLPPKNKKSFHVPIPCMMYALLLLSGMMSLVLPCLL